MDMFADGPAPPCHHCGAPSTLLCDGRLVVQADKEGPRGGDWLHGTCFGGRIEEWVCDRPLCEDCTTEHGRGHMCGEDGCEVFTIDYCRECARPIRGQRNAHGDEASERLRAVLERRPLAGPKDPLDTLTE